MIRKALFFSLLAGAIIGFFTPRDSAAQWGELEGGHQNNGQSPQYPATSSNGTTGGNSGISSGNNSSGVPEVGDHHRGGPDNNSSSGNASGAEWEPISVYISEDHLKEIAKRKTTLAEIVEERLKQYIDRHFDDVPSTYTHQGEEWKLKEKGKWKFKKVKKEDRRNGRKNFGRNENFRSRYSDGDRLKATRDSQYERKNADSTEGSDGDSSSEKIINTGSLKNPYTVVVTETKTVSSKDPGEPGQKGSGFQNGVLHQWAKFALTIHVENPKKKKKKKNNKNNKKSNNNNNNNSNNNNNNNNNTGNSNQNSNNRSGRSSNSSGSSSSNSSSSYGESFK